MHDCTPKTPCDITTEADAEAKTRANLSLALIQEKVTATSEREPISTTAIEIFNSSITPRATEPTIPIEQGSLYAGQLSAGMQQRAEPMAQVLTVAAVVATAEIALPVAALTAAGTGATTLGMGTATATNTAVAGEIAVIGTTAQTASHAGVAGYNVLQVSNAAYTFGGANVPWVYGAIRAGQPVLVKSAQAGLAAVEMQMFKNSGYMSVGNMLFPP
jgi:hypothetical protein